MSSTWSQHNTECADRCDHLADEIDALRGDQDEALSSLADYTTGVELENEVSHLDGRIDGIESSHITLQDRHDSAVSRLDGVNRECFDRIGHLEADNHSQQA